MKPDFERYPQFLSEMFCVHMIFSAITRKIRRVSTFKVKNRIYGFYLKNVSMIWQGKLKIQEF